MTVKCPRCDTENTSDSRFCKKCATPLPSATKGLGSPKAEIGGHEPSSPEFGVVSPGLKTQTLHAPIKELSTGSTFAGRYQIIEELGRGGMGKVYKVFDTDIKDKVALKLLKPEIASDQETIERFSNELKFARKISHRNVCRMYDLGKSEGTQFITMEYVQGEDLKSMIRMTGMLGIGTVLSVGKQVCEGLSEAHSLGVVHRDLKPTNIMIDKGGNAKIMDFGIARSLRERGITGPSVMIGTPEYMSPEQAEAKEVDQRSDIYSLGVILYEMATGRVPFEGDTALSIAMKHKGEAPTKPKQFNPSIPDDLSAVILKCLEKDKANRYQTSADVRSELEKIEKGIPTTERVIPERKPLTSKEITVKFKLKKLLIPTLIFIALIAAGIILWRILPAKKAAPPPSASGMPTLAVLYFENKTGDKSLDEWSTGFQDLLITDLSQSKFLRVLSGDKIYSILKKLDLQETKRYSTDELIKVANEGAAEYTVSGSFIKAGSLLLISATLQMPRTERVIKNMRVECRSLDEITVKVDALTKELKAGLNLSGEQIAADLDKNLSKITSQNPEALRYYVEAKRYHWKGEYHNAIPLLEKAIALDSEFIMAYEALASAHYNLGEYALNENYSAKTLALIKSSPDRIGDKDRYSIEGRHYLWDRSDQFWLQAIEDLNRVLDVDPEDSLTNYDLGTLYSFLEQWDKALTYFNVCLKNRFEFVELYRRTAGVFRAKGMPDKARETLEYYLENVADTASGRFYLAQHHLTQGKLDLARHEIERGIVLDPTDSWNDYGAGLIALIGGDLGQAEKEFIRLIADKDAELAFMSYNGLRCLYLEKGKFSKVSQLYIPFIEKMLEAGEKHHECGARMKLAYVYIKSENPGKALDECRRAWDVATGLDELRYQRDILFIKGLAYLELESIPEAEKAAEELKEVNARGLRKDVDVRIYDHLVGRIELEKKNYRAAIERLKKAVDLFPYGPFETDASYIDSLALAYFRAGDFGKAQAECERIPALTTGRLNYGDIYAKAYYMLAKIAEQQGDKARAVENYRKFLDLWKDADAGLPEVEDARKRLAALGT